MFDFLLQDQCLPSAAGALAEQVGSFDLFGLFCWFVGGFVGWFDGLLVDFWLVCSVRCLVEQVGFFDLVGLLLMRVIPLIRIIWKSLICSYSSLLLKSKTKKYTYLKYLDIEKCLNQITNTCQSNFPLTRSFHLNLHKMNLCIKFSETGFG